jgi:predicted nucleic-acid-binding Zn-ribbon protein
MMTKCPKCESTEIIPDIFVVTGNNLYASVSLQAPKGSKAEDFYSHCQASVCGSCGYLEVYVQDIAQMLAAYKSGATTELPWELRK